MEKKVMRSKVLVEMYFAVTRTRTFLTQSTFEVEADG
jgi:hypothetical protein